MTSPDSIRLPSITSCEGKGGHGVVGRGVLLKVPSKRAENSPSNNILSDSGFCSNILLEISFLRERLTGRVLVRLWSSKVMLPNTITVCKVADAELKGYR